MKSKKSNLNFDVPPSVSCSASNLTPSNQPPVLVNSSAQRNLLSDLSTGRLRQCNLREILNSLLVRCVRERGYKGRTALTLRTFPPVEVEPMLTIKVSPFASFWTLVCFLSSPVALTPSNLLVNSRCGGVITVGGGSN